MAETRLLRKTPEWEKARPGWAIYEHFFYNDAGQVRKVEGLVENNRLIKDDRGIVQEVRGYKEVRWDGYGCCWSVPHNVRNRKYDIRFD
jgi:hypothetical protein